MSSFSSPSPEDFRVATLEFFEGLERGPYKMSSRIANEGDSVCLERDLSTEAWLLALAKYTVAIKERKPLSFYVEIDEGDLAPVVLPLPVRMEPYNIEVVTAYTKLFEELIVELFEIPKKHNREKRWRWADKLIYVTDQTAPIVTGKIIYTHLTLGARQQAWLLGKFNAALKEAAAADQLPASYAMEVDQQLVYYWTLCGSPYFMRGIKGALNYWRCMPEEALADVKRTHTLMISEQKKLLKSIPPEVLCSDPLTASKAYRLVQKPQTLTVAPASDLPEAGDGLVDPPSKEEVSQVLTPRGYIGLREVKTAASIRGDVRVFRTVADIPQLVLLRNAGETIESLVSKWMFVSIPQPATVAWVAQLLMEVYLPGLVFLTPNVSYVLDVGTCSWIGADADDGALESRVAWAINYLAGDVMHIRSAWKPPILDKEQTRAFQTFVVNWFNFSKKVDNDIRGVTVKVLNQIMYYVKEASLGSLASLEGRFNARSYTLPFKNGNLDLATGHFAARKNTDCTVGVVPIYYRGLQQGEDPKAKYSEMTEYLWEFSCRREEVFRDILKTLYMCFFPENRHKYCVFWYGPSNTSKSSLISILKRALGGSESELIAQLPQGMFTITNASATTHAGTKTELKQSHRILWMDETSRLDRWDAGLIKPAVNGEQEFLIRPCGSSKIRKLKFSALLNIFTNTNGLPVIVNAIGDDAIANRVRGIKCECRYVEKAEYAKIPQEERDFYAVKDDERRDMLFRKCDDLVMLALLLGGQYYRETKEQGVEPLKPDEELLRRLVNTDAAAEAAESFKEWFLARYVHAGPPPYAEGTPLVNLAALRRDPEVAVRFREELKLHRTTEALWQSMNVRDEQGKPYMMGRVVGGLRCKATSFIPFVLRHTESRPDVVHRAASSVMQFFTSDGQPAGERPRMRSIGD